ncbi:MAG: DNA starvation/stationary phase protection protein [Cytophagales bacterium]|nr:DNA starvation/stationary phase protection protein [Cytophagales bacterium]
MPIATKKPVPLPKTQADPSANGTAKAEPLLNQHGPILQKYGTVLPKLPLALDVKIREASVERLNQVLADTMTLRDLYKKHHWQIVGPTFYQLHLLFDKHYTEQSELIDEIAERIQILGGLSVAMAPDVAELTRIPRAPRDREEVPVQLSRLLEAHNVILEEVRAAAQEAADAGDDGTNDLLVSQVLRTNELQVWFLYEHVVDTPLTRAD